LSRDNTGDSCQACLVSTIEPARGPRIQAQNMHPLRRVRLRRGMTLATLAGLSGLSASFLCRIENGQRELSRKSHITALAAALRVPPVDLVPWVLHPLDVHLSERSCGELPVASGAVC
jgi:DNA-binding Xre family transcriptional regulator